MKRRRFALTAGLVILAIVAVSACASLSGTKSEYIAVSKEYTRVSKQYNDAFDLAPPEVQAKWYKEIDPAFDAADNALDAWRDSLGGDNAELRYQIFDRAFKALMSMLIRYKIVEVTP
jgi:hypothetical protein